MRVLEKRPLFTPEGGDGVVAQGKRACERTPGLGVEEKMHPRRGCRKHGWRPVTEFTF